MPISIRCSNCQKKLRVAEKFAGKEAKCPSCRQLVKVPAFPVKAIPLLQETPLLSLQPAKAKTSRRLWLVLLALFTSTMLAMCCIFSIFIWPILTNQPLENGLSLVGKRNTSTINRQGLVYSVFLVANNKSMSVLGGPHMYVVVVLENKSDTTAFRFDNKSARWIYANTHCSDEFGNDYKINIPDDNLQLRTHQLAAIAYLRASIKLFVPKGQIRPGEKQVFYHMFNLPVEKAKRLNFRIPTFLEGDHNFIDFSVSLKRKSVEGNEILYLAPSVKSVKQLRPFLQDFNSNSEGSARLQAMNLTSACEAFRVNNNDQYPQALQQLLDPNIPGGPYLERADRLIDPWGNPYQYDRSGKKNAAKGHSQPDIYTINPNTKMLVGNW